MIRGSSPWGLYRLASVLGVLAGLALCSAPAAAKPESDASSSKAKKDKKKKKKKDKRGEAIERIAKNDKSDSKKDKDDKKSDDETAPAAAAKSASWVLNKPAPETQTQKTAAERGVNPCNTPDPGWGIYDHWSRAPSMGQMIMPQKGGVTGSGAFDVVFHFHGHEPVRKEWVRVMDGAVLVGIDLGIGSGPYASAFGSPEAFKKLVESVEKAVAQKTGKKNAHVRKIGLSAWSAGYGAVGEILGQDYAKKNVDVVILLDGLHSGYSGNSLNEAQLKPFVEFAREAAQKHRFMFVSHSSIIPPGYASTTETANFLIQKVGGKPSKRSARNSDPMGLAMNSRYSKGNFHVRGYDGNDKMDHCAHIGLLKDVLKVHLKPRWNSPKGHK